MLSLHPVRRFHGNRAKTIAIPHQSVSPAKVNPKLNAIVRPMDEIDDARVKEPLTGPFAGVPFLLKDLMQQCEAKFYQTYTETKSSCPGPTSLSGTFCRTIKMATSSCGDYCWRNSNCIKDCESYIPTRNMCNPKLGRVVRSPAQPARWGRIPGNKTASTSGKFNQKKRKSSLQK